MPIIHSARTTPRSHTDTMKTQLTLPKTCKLESVCCTGNAARPALQNPFIQEGRIITANRSVIASIGCDEDIKELEGKKLPIEALKAARKVRGTGHDAKLSIDGERCEVAGGASFPMPETNPAPPNVAAIVSARRDSSSDDAFCVSLDVSLLMNLADALGSSQLRLVFDKTNPNAMITATPITGTDAFGMIMPMRGN